jgi:hypothetical protein
VLSSALEHKYGDLQEKPAGMSDLEFRLLNEAAGSRECDFLLAPCGVPNQY